MKRVDQAIARITNMLVFLASDDTIPTEIREGLVDVVELQLQAQNRLKILMMRGVDTPLTPSLTPPKPEPRHADHPL